MGNLDFWIIYPKFRADGVTEKGNIVNGSIKYAEGSSGFGIYIGNGAINTGNCFVIRGNVIGSPTFPAILKYVSGTVSTLYTLNAASSKIVIKWDGIYINVFINGTQVVTNSAFTTTNMNNFVSNAELTTNIKIMALYPLPLTDAQCLSLSTQ
jgi:hypothetical protein